MPLLKDLFSRAEMAEFFVISCQFALGTIKKNMPRIIKIGKKLVIKIDQAELIFLLRRFFAIFNTLLAGPFLMIIKSNYFSGMMSMFILGTIVSLLFILISDLYRNDSFQIEAIKFGIPTKEGSLTKFLEMLHKKEKVTLVFYLFFLESTYFLLFYREGHHKYNGLVNPKTFLTFLFSCIVSTIVWSPFSYLVKILWDLIF